MELFKKLEGEKTQAAIKMTTNIRETVCTS